MSANTPTKPTEAPNEPAKPAKFDPFRAEMPQIPGVTPGAPREEKHPAEKPAVYEEPAVESGSPQNLKIAALIGGMVLLVAALFWLSKIRSRPSASTAGAEEATADQTQAPASSGAAPLAQDGPTVAATASELSKPWSYKRFVFAKPFSRENVDAMVIRLPDKSLWAFALQGPYDHCKLEFVSDLGVLSSRYRIEASHPMVVSPCDGTVYDPLKVGPLGIDTWARGEIVRGSSLRPPLAIDVKESGGSIVADNME